MSEDADLPPPGISDLDLMRLIERVTGRSATMADAKAWRRVIERERARRARARLRLPPAPPLSEDAESAHAVILDMIMSPEGQVLIAVLRAGGTLIADLLDDASRTLYRRMLGERTIARDVRADIDGLMQYAAEKASLGGRPPPPWPDPACGLPGVALAALNAATLGGAAEWRDRLVAARRAPATRPHLLRRLCSEGREVMLAHPDLDIGRPMSGPALGIWPPPAKPEAEAAEAREEADKPGWRR